MICRRLIKRPYPPAPNSLEESFRKLCEEALRAGIDIEKIAKETIIKDVIE